MLYIITDGTNYKLGYSQNPAARLKELQTANAKPLVLLGTTEGEIEDEKHYHKLLSNTQLVGEWFSPSPKLFEILSIFTQDSNPPDYTLQSLTNACLLAYLLRNGISKNDIKLLPLKFKDPVNNLPFIKESLICLAYFTSRLNIDEEGLIKNLVKHHWLKDKTSAHPWLIQRTMPIAALLNLGLKADRLELQKFTLEPIDKIIGSLFLNCYTNDCNKFMPTYAELSKAYKNSLTTEFPKVKNVFKFIIDELKATNNLGLLTLYRQQQMDYGVLFDKLAGGKSPLVEIPDDYFTNQKALVLGEEILWLGE